MKRGTLALILLAACVLMGLRGGMDVEEQAFVVSMGLDREADGRVRVTLQIPSAQQGNEGGGTGGASTSGYELMSCMAANYVDALELLRASIPRDVNFSQILQVIVSEELAKEASFTDLMESLLTTKGIRQSATVVVCRGTAHDFNEKQQTFFGVRLSNNIKTSLEVFGKQGNIPSVSLGQVIRMGSGAWKDLLLPYAAISNTGEAAEPAEGAALSVLPGEIPFEGYDVIEYLGAALLREGRMVGVLTGEEMRFMKFLQADMEQFTFNVDGVYYKMDQILPASLSVEQSGEQWTLNVGATVKACVLRHGESDKDRVKQAFEQEVINLISKMQALGVDPAGFEGKAVRSAATIANWEQVDWMKRYQNAAVKVGVKIVIGEVQ